MRFVKVLDTVNQIEKSSFYKILDTITNDLRESNKEINKILSQGDDQIKNMEDETIVNLFQLTHKEFLYNLAKSLQYNDFHLGILIDIIIRDGNSILSREWLAQLYDYEIKELKKHIKAFNAQLDKEVSVLDEKRKRDYSIFRECVLTAYTNDEEANREKVVTKDEKQILDTLAKALELSLEEVRIIYYSIVGLEKVDIEKIIYSLKELGAFFYSRKRNILLIPDEIIWLLRELVGVELPNKYFRRILRKLKDSEINRVARKHNIDTKVSREEKIRLILMQGISAKGVLLSDIYKDGISKKDIKNYLAQLIEKELNISLPRWGSTADERVELLIEYFQEMERDENIGMSTDGFTRLLNDLSTVLPNINQLIRNEFELQQDNVLSAEIMIDYNLKPVDILYLLNKNKLMKFCGALEIKTRGATIFNIFEAYKDTENLYLENYVLFGARDFNSLLEKGITIKESEIGVKFESLTKKIFEDLGYEVDEQLRKQINTKRDKMDILINLGNNEVLIIECKTTKDKDYNKYASVSRQLKAYEKLCKDKGLRLLKTLLVTNAFSEDFISECEYDYELNLSLICSEGLLKILKGFKDSSLAKFPTKLLLKGGALNPDRVVSALNR
ncbi:MAG: hypothetical protein FVQ81_16305 [Candidatus Glassbacteria bacterium]|nr:hypothetical protein [Candidatus Glassbacteria bacterium]